ncbi:MULTISPECIES: MerR family transcriptional regulator [Sphingobium]|uniref:HTH merR-type domain-containing protein n=2 Tax=Sphingobium fuliginis (strain ATCC 27551) TaxID=336203 RepID=A0ABQ1F9X9_SPHSA|nr:MULTISPECIES: MerR family transcriptional regulator [Sphingobium]OAP31510.1 transcriptional regulator [Sphingobium sp. 20006FA]AJR24258.1 transcriptional regulator [Sphingobium sp. YBL2]KXU30356.1 transcriptional regulator [Sphingobium sp. AM]KYC31288.1 transcriptional regulator [Sphingobium sp. 22B]MCB4861737.1 MerR family transcriptional regulator [Sphingobium sp. PNB]
MEKAEGAFLTISELASELDLPQHILRYWETRFTQLRPLQRSGNRRYYRPADVALVRRINHLLNVEGFTVRGAQKALADGGGEPPVAPAPKNGETAPHADLLPRLEAIRALLVRAIGE